MGGRTLRSGRGDELGRFSGGDEKDPEMEEP